MAAFTTNLTLGANSFVRNAELDENVSIAGKRTRGNALTTLVAGADTVLAGDSHATIKDDAMVYDLTVNGVNRLRFSGFTTFELGEGDDVLDLTVQPRNVGSAWTAAIAANGGNGDDVIWSGSGDDTLNGDAGSDRLWGGAGNDTVGGGDHNDMLRGGAGLDTLTGGNGDDEIFGGADDDTLNGGDGADTLRGEDGNDVLRGGAGLDRTFGGGGDDVFQIAGTEAAAGDGYAGSDGNDTIRNVGGAVVVLNLFRNLVEYDSTTEVFDGGGFAVNGTDGNDGFDFGGIGSIVDTPFIDGLAGNDEMYGNGEANDLRGGDGDDSLDGRNGNDVLRGGAGLDRTSGGGGDDVFQIAGTEAASGDGYAGGDGTDTIRNVGGAVVVLGQFNAGIHYDSSTEVFDGGGFAVNGTAGDDSLDFLGIGSIVDTPLIDGLGGNDGINGNDQGNRIHGGAGDDTIYGYGGSDILRGGDGLDRTFGSGGDDVFEIAGTEAANNDLYAGADGTDTIRNVGGAVVVLNLFRNLVEYDSTTEVFDGGRFAVNGTDGNNTLDFSAIGSIVDTPFIDGLDGLDTITGNAEANDLRGGSGNDTANGGDGNDRLLGDAGDDTLSGGAGADWIYGGADTGLLSNGAGGGGAITALVRGDRIRGGADADTFVWRNGDGKDGIVDFTDNVDRLLIEGTATLTANAAQFSLLGSNFAVGSSTVVSVGGSATILVAGMGRSGGNFLLTLQGQETLDGVTYNVWS